MSDVQLCIVNSVYRATKIAGSDLWKWLHFMTANRIPLSVGSLYFMKQRKELKHNFRKCAPAGPVEVPKKNQVYGNYRSLSKIQNRQFLFCFWNIAVNQIIAAMFATTRRPIKRSIKRIICCWFSLFWGWSKNNIHIAIPQKFNRWKMHTCKLIFQWYIVKI